MGSGLWGLTTPNSTVCPGWPCSGNLVGRADTNTKMPSYLGALLIGPQFFKKILSPSLFLGRGAWFRWRRKWQPTPVFLPGESQGWGSLVGCHLWGRTESDATETTQQQQQQHGSGRSSGSDTWIQTHLCFYLITVKLLDPSFNSFGQRSCMYAPSCLTLWDPMDCSLPSSPVHGIFQARILKWVVISFSRGIFPIQGSNPRPQRLLRWQADSLPLSHPVFYYLCDLVPVTFEASAASFAKRGFDEMRHVNFLAEFPAHRKQLHKQVLFFN